MEWRRRRQGEQEARAFLRESRREVIEAPAAAFIEGAHRGHTACTKDQGGKEQASLAPSPGEKFETPTSPDSHTRRMHALISQVKRRVRSGHNGTAVLTPHARRLKRSTLKRYVKAVPSRASGARPPADQSRRVVSVGHRFRLARPPVNPEQKLQGGFCQVQILSR